jgi:DNA polymerase-3 subunit epsilon
MKLNLKKPLAIFDLETTGTSVATDRIVEMTIVKVHPDGSKDIKEKRINPTIPIPKESSEIHGIYDEDVKDSPTFKSIAKSLNEFLEGCDLGGFNSNKFDVPLLAEEFLRADIDFDINGRNLIDTQNIFHKMEPRTLTAAFRFYCDKKLIGAHGATADTLATLEILEAQVERYGGREYEDKDGNMHVPIVNDMDELHEYSKRTNNADLMGRIVFNEDNVEVFNFGKHKGVPVEQVLSKEPGYYNWMMNGDFPRYTKKVLQEIKVRIFNKEQKG